MKLEIIAGPDKGKVQELPLDREIQIGRGPSADLRLNDAESSRAHARIFLENGLVFVEDLDSTNGTAVNGTKVLRRDLTEGDELLIGESTIRVTDLPVLDQAQSTLLDVHTGPSNIVVSLEQEQASLLRADSTAGTQTEILHENEVLKQVCDISQLLASAREPQSVIVSALEKAREILLADTACFLVRADEDSEWTVRAAASAIGDPGSVAVSQTVIRGAVEEGKAIIAKDIREDRRFAPSESIILQGISSLVCSPVRADDKIEGLLVLDRRSRRRAFEPIDLRFTATVASLLGLCLEREKYEADARSKARLATIGEVIAGLAHYTKNIVAGLRFSTAHLNAIVERKHFDRLGKCVDSISAQEQRISDLMLNMLSYAKERKPGRSEVKIPELLEAVVEPYRSHMAEQGIELLLDCSPETPVVYADEQSMHRVFLNLVMNAADAFKTKEDGAAKTVTVTSRPTPEADAAEIRVRDSGSGIPEDKLAKIFTVFYSTKGSEGTGLGLAVVHKTITEHGGDIAVESVENEWSEFCVTLPIGSKGETKGAPTDHA